MSEVWQRHPLDDAPLKQRIDSRRLTRGKRPGIGFRSQLMREPGDKEHHFSRFVARIRGAVTEIYPRRTQRPCTAFNGGADAFRRAQVSCRADGLDGCVG